MQADLIATVPCGCTLGEGILWDDRIGAFFWTDIQGQALHRYDLASDKHTAVTLPDRLASFALTSDPGRLLAAFDRQIAWLDVDGGTLQRVAAPVLLPGVRMNDGRTDPVGRFWVGTMVEHAEAAGGDRRGELFRFDADGTLSVHRGGIGISNGLAFSPDGHWMYFADSTKAQVMKIAFSHGGTLMGETPFFASDGGTAPDGAAVSADGWYFSALWGGGRIAVLSPQGERVAEIAVPASQPSCCAFGGAGLDILAVTSAAEGLEGAARAADPNAGHVFLYQTDAQGLAAVPFAGHPP
ncbi:MAG: SMP-30/gluconolactonase/LRE family protein [Pseudomonadota bacterium]